MSQPALFREKRSDIRSTSIVNVNVARSFEGNYFPASEIKPARDAVRENYFGKVLDTIALDNLYKTVRAIT